MILKIDCNFAEHGLTLEEAFVLARVQYYEEDKTPCIESNLTIAKAMAKSESTARRAIESLIEKGYLKREIVKKARILSINGVHNEQQNEQVAESKMSDKEVLQRLQEKIKKNKIFYKDVDEDFY